MTDHTKNENFKYLCYKVSRGWLKKNIPISKEYKDRKNYELSIIGEMNFCDYFLIIADLINWAKSQSIPVGPGRGSGAGSIICYALDITTLDPIQFGLLFERFLNPSRISMPDIDIDLCRERRNEVIEYAKNKYGEDRVAHIISFGSMKLRGAIRDVARAQGIRNYVNIADRIAKSISTKAKSIGDAIEASDFLAAQKKQYPDLFSMAEYISGKTRNTSTHPAGVIITPEPLTNYMPLYYSSKIKDGDTPVTQWDMYDIEDTGFLKIDFLGLNTLTIIQRTVDRINRDAIRASEENLDRKYEELNIEDINLEDEITLQLFSNGLTTGIFQLERKYVQDFCKRMGVATFMDVVNMNAIIRPGTMDAGTTEQFIKRRKGEVPVEFMHESLSDVLAPTYGILVFQEQAIKIAQVFAGFSLAEADNLRKAIGKKIVSKMAQIKKQFILSSVKNMGRTKEDAEMVFSYIEAGERYSFNLSHATAYGKITVQAAWLKSHYTIEYLCELLNGELGSSTGSKVNEYIEESRFFGIEIIPPNVNSSEAMFTIRSGTRIEFGLSFIMNVSLTASDHIRSKRGSWVTALDFLLDVETRTVKMNAVISLINAGAMDDFGTCRDELIEKCDRLRKIVNKYKSQQKRIKNGVKVKEPIKMSDLLEEESICVTILNARDAEKALEMERIETHARLTESPFSPFLREIREHTNTDVRDLCDGYCTDFGNLCLAGMIESIKEHVIKKGRNEGQEMAFVTVSKDQRQIDVIVFSELYYQLKHILKVGKVFLFYGYMKDTSFITSDVRLLSTL